MLARKSFSRSLGALLLLSLLLAMPTRAFLASPALHTLEIDFDLVETTPEIRKAFAIAIGEQALGNLEGYQRFVVSSLYRQEQWAIATLIGSAPPPLCLPMWRRLLRYRTI